MTTFLQSLKKTLTKRFQRLFVKYSKTKYVNKSRIRILRFIKKYALLRIIKKYQNYASIKSIKAKNKFQNFCSKKLTWMRSKAISKIPKKASQKKLYEVSLYFLLPGPLLGPRPSRPICIYRPWPLICIYRSWHPICIYQP